MSYKEVLNSNQNTADFDASGEELLIIRHVGADVTLSLLYPDGRDAQPLLTFTKSGNQRWRAPKGTRLRLEASAAGATAWVGKIYADGAGDLLS